MSFEFFLILIIILLIRLKFVNLYSNDDWVYHWYIKKNKKKINYSTNESFLNGIHSKPVLHSYIISFFPESKWKIVGIFLNFIFDFLTMAIMILLLKSFFFNSDSSKYIELSLLIFFSSPNLNPAIGRIQTCSARTFGLFIFSAFVYCSYFLQINDVLNLIILCFISTLAIMSSLFAAQAIFFFSIIFSILISNPLIFLSVIFSYILPFFFNFKAKENILYSFHQKIWYFNSMNQNTSAHSINLFSGFLIFFNLRSLLNINKNFIISIMHQIFKNNSLFVFIIYNLPLILFFYFFYFLDNNNLIIMDDYFLILFYITLSMIICFFITSIKYFRFLGQPQRYMEYALPFYSILVCWFFISINQIELIYILILLNIIFSIAIYLIFIKRSNQKKELQNSREFNSIIKWLNKNALNKNILINPVKLAYLFSYQQLLNRLDKKIYFYFRNIIRKNEYGFKYYFEDCSYEFGPEFEGFIQKNGKYLKKKYKLDYIILEKIYLKFISNKSLRNNFSEIKNKKFLETKNFIIYKT